MMDRFDGDIRAFLEDEAEAMPGRAGTAEDMAARVAERVRRRSVPRFLEGPALFWPRAARAAWVATLVALLLTLLGVLAWTGSPPAPPRIVRIALDLPLGQANMQADAAVNAVRLALATIDGRVGGFQVEVPQSAVFDHATAGSADVFVGNANALRITQDSAYVALIGPLHSSVAAYEISVTNAAGLLQCGPSTTAPFLTRGPDAEAIRARPDRPSFVRVVGADDTTMRRMAGFAFREREARTVFVIEGPEEDFGGLFLEAFQALGGTSVGRMALSERATREDTIAVMRAAAATDPDAIFFAGGAEPAGWLLEDASAAGLRGITFLSTEQVLGTTLDWHPPEPAADRVAAVFAPFPAAFDSSLLDAFRSRYGREYAGESTLISAAAYACTQVVLEGLRNVGDARLDMASIRDGVRQTVTDPARGFETLMGRISFDERGDVVPDRTTVYEYDPEGGMWVVRMVMAD